MSAHRRPERAAAPITVILDSTALRGHEKRLNLAPLANLAKPAAKAGIIVRLPFVVMMELARGGWTETKTHHEAVSRALRASRQIGLPGPEWPKPDRKEVTKAIEKAIWSAAEGCDFSILGIPEVSHEDLLRREFRHGKPFKPDGSGYRDALIWHSILEYAQEEEPGQIFFVTNNTTDFANKDGSLDELLAAEAEKAKAKIILVKDVHHLIASHIGPMLNMVNTAVGQPFDKAYPLAKDDLLRALNQHLAGVTTFSELGDDIGDDNIIERHSPSLGNVEWARDVGDGNILVQLGAPMYVLGAYDVSDPHEPPIHEYESGTLTFTIQALIGPDGKLLNAEILPIQVKDTDLGELDELERINLFSKYEDEDQ